MSYGAFTAYPSGSRLPSVSGTQLKRQPRCAVGQGRGTPDTAVVFEPTVLKTSAIVTLVIFGWRAVASLVRTMWRHPVALLVTAVPCVLSVLYGWRVALLLVTPMLVGTVVWGVLDRVSFARWIGWRLLAWWRLVWVYRRLWQPVMVISGRGRHVRGRDYLPKLGKITCTSWADLVTVRMLNGQAVKHWADRTDNLALGFGVSSCRVSVLKGEWLRLTFPRSDPLTVPLPAVPIPETPTVGPIEVGKQEDGRPWFLKVHGTHVLVAGATGAGKGSIIWSTIRGLLPAVTAGIVELWALDPKLMEPSFGRPLFGARYAADPEGLMSVAGRCGSIQGSQGSRSARSVACRSGR